MIFGAKISPLTVYSPLLEKSVVVDVREEQAVTRLFDDIRDKVGDRRINDLCFHRGSTLSQRENGHGVVNTLSTESGLHQVSSIGNEVLQDLLQSGHIVAYDGSLGALLPNASRRHVARTAIGCSRHKKKKTSHHGRQGRGRR